MSTGLNLDGLDASILGPACAAGLIVLSTHVLLGRRVLARNIIFIDLAIAQIAALGVIVAQYLHIIGHSVGVQLSATGAALAGAILLSFTDKRWPRIQEPIIGVLFVLAATGGIMFLANNPEGSEHLKEMLVGQILWVSYDQLLWPLLLSIVLLAAIIWRLNNLTGAWFYTLFAVAITASVQLVGVYLVFASLIVPGLATIGMQGRAQLAWAYGIGIAGYVSGLALSAVFDLPSGPMVVWSLVACGLLAKLHPDVRRNNMPLDRRTRPAPEPAPPAA
ncbi:MAG: hypothetical protein RIS14_918 [Pseudomonadota bacterium]|jgi:zinc/manganese transport system permease protein